MKILIVVEIENPRGNFRCTTLIKNKVSSEKNKIPKKDIRSKKNQRVNFTRINGIQPTTNQTWLATPGKQ